MAGEYRWDVQSGIVQQRRARLIMVLGGHCTQCGDVAIDRLEFHHTHGKTWRSNSVGPLRRMELYERDAASGLLQLLCVDCHRNPNDHPDTCFCPFCRGSDF